MLLIITNKNDLASDYLILRIKERGINFTRLNTEDIGLTVSIDLSVTNNSIDFKIDFPDGTKLLRKDISGVYFRQPIPPNLKELVIEEELEFANVEILELLRSLWRMLPEEIWLNHPKKLWAASNKLEQLAVAASIGLLIPNTLVSSNPASIESFLKSESSELIAKAIRHGFLNRERSVFLAGTQRISKDFIDNIDKYAAVPMMYQKEIQRDCDLRVVVVDDKVFPTSIIYDDHSKNVDWRISDLQGEQLKYTKVTLSPDLEDKCKAIVRFFALRYSSIDMIKDKSGNYYFLELNPNGQWAWIEQSTGYPIRDAIIDSLNK